MGFTFCDSPYRIEHMKLTTLLSLLLIISLPAEAGRIYRFTDDNGVSTLSKSLPPYAAQKGYDILDETSLRLIERVHSREESIKIQQEQAIRDKINSKKQQHEEAERQHRIDQRIRDKNLVSRYPSLEVFTKSRDNDLNYRQAQITDVNELLKSNKQRLVELQTKAAELELSGGEISETLEKQLSETQKEIDQNKAFIARVYEEKRRLTQQYTADFERLKQLLETEE